MAPMLHSHVDACVDAVLADVGPDIVLGIPIALGKPNHFVNALFARAMRDRSITLKIFTGLTFVKPSGATDIERRFVSPLAERLLGGYPMLDYVEPIKNGRLPPNIEVHEFFFQAGAFLGSPLAQQSYDSLNYTHVPRHVLSLGLNVLAQLVAKPPSGGGDRFSLGSNTDITLEVLPALTERRKAGQRIAVVGQVNAAMPFMGGEAAVPASTFDHILEGAAYEFPLFAPPKTPVSFSDYAAAIHTAGLVKDGGTIQLGIGAFSDALTQALLIRQQQNSRFEELARALGAGRLHPRLPLETAPFAKGLYGATELLVDGYIALYRAGILKRRVFDDVEIQRRADAGQLSPEDYSKGALVHAGFFFGSNGFYEALRGLSADEREAFRMVGISYVNQLYGAEALKRAQRPHARFINSAMMATLLGAVVSDQLEDGRVVSGVGGQYNFVAQAHELKDGRSILELHATRMDKGRLRSNIRWTYGHTTISRHLRDIVVTEYGAADLRGLSDRDTIAAMLNIADSRFQDALLQQAKDARKIESGYEIPSAFRDNTPAMMEKVLAPSRVDGTLPDFPLGTEMSAEELALLPALSLLGEAQYAPTQLARLLAKGFTAPSRDERALLRRLALDRPRSIKERAYAALVVGALRSTG